MVPVAVARASLSALMALFTAEAPLCACLCECVIRVSLFIADCKRTDRKEAGKNMDANGPIVRNLTRFYFLDFAW